MSSNGTQQVIGRSFVIDACGGYSIQQTFPEILNSTEFFIQNALQIRVGADFLNKKIGITKDASNANVLEIEYDTVNDKYVTDSLAISAEELIQLARVDNIISMGSLSTLYSDFNYTVLEYFGAPYGFSSLFSGEENYNINNGVFDASALVHIINGGTFTFAGSYVSDLSGSVNIQNITDVIRYACSNNPFQNRPVSGNYTVQDGFIANDLIYATGGMSITLSVDIEPEPYLPIYNVGPANLATVDNTYHTLNYTNNLTLVKKQTTATRVNITQVYTVPILFIVSNINDIVIEDFGMVWTNVVNEELDNISWLSCAISSSGKYQTAVEEFGDIYISSDYGVTWTNSYNMGNAPTNCISMSFSGQYQTASNGVNIMVSNDYGSTWTETYSVGNTQIFVCISLSGRYQLVISAGDSMYRSTDFGVTWNRYDNENTDIYNSIMSFPSMGVCMSYDGQYQTIVCENIYRSNDYGVNWSTTTILTDEDGGIWDDHNWYGVDMSSDGRYQVAIEVIGEIYVSTDYGENWAKVDAPMVSDITWQAISISANGQFMTAVAKGGSVYYSSDFGVTWTKNSNPDLDNKEWSCVAVSSNAQYQLAAVYGGSIYTSKLI
jgi:photosystem II stability/assembly factor-like uncharacterized protein